MFSCLSCLSLYVFDLYLCIDKYNNTEILAFFVFALLSINNKFIVKQLEKTMTKV